MINVLKNRISVTYWTTTIAIVKALAVTAARFIPSHQTPGLRSTRNTTASTPSVTVAQVTASTNGQFRKISATSVPTGTIINDADRTASFSEMSGISSAASACLRSRRALAAKM